MGAASERTEADQWYGALIEQAPDPVITLDRLGTVRFLNSAAERVSGYAARELVGKHFTLTNVLTPAGVAKAVQEFALVVGGQARPPFELEIVPKAGERITMEASPQLITKRDGGVNVQVMFHDVTRRKQAEEALKREHQEVVRMNKLMMGREERILELKREVNNLLRQLGQPSRYEA